MDCFTPVLRGYRDIAELCIQLMFYVDISSELELLMLVIGVIALRRSIKETAGMIGAGAVFAIIMKADIPFRIW